MIGQMMTKMRRLAWLFPVFLALAPFPAVADGADALRSALGDASRGDWASASATAQGAGQVGADIIEWQRLRAGEGRLGEYEACLARRADWPGLPLLKEKGEEAVARSTDPQRVVAYFGAGRPETATGALALINALRSLGRAAEAELAENRAENAASLGRDALGREAARAAASVIDVFRELERSMPLMNDGKKRYA